MKIQLITRKERFLYEIAGWGETAPKNELTTEELFFAKILGRNVTLPDLSNVPRYYLFLAKIAGENVNISPPTYTSPRLEFFLAKAAGMDVVTPVPLTKEEIFWANYKGIEQIIEGVPPLTFKSNGANLSNYRIYGNTVNGESVGNLVESGEHTGEYRVPVTVSNGTYTQTISIYLPEQIKNVGDEEEYIDYAEQKLHRVRKNLLQNTGTSRTINGVTFTVNSDGSVTCNTDENGATATAILNIRAQEITLASNNYILSGCPIGGDIYAKYKLDAQVYGDGIERWLADSGNGVNISSDKTITVKLTRIVIYTGQVCNNLTFYPMIRKADISDDTYEPYIEDTELDITLPALPTLSGTNTLSFETPVPPSKVMIKTGKFGTHKVRYYDSDGTFLSAEDVKDGTNAQGFTPTKASTAQYNYTFMGWSTTKGSTTAEMGVLNDITADKSLYAVFSQSLRTFTVYFYNGGTLLQTTENVQYGGTATYAGEAPTKDGFTFSRWQPSNVNITADTSCYAQFVGG